ncbi:hypothetical protein CDAR_164901 [Caerostris darwini]|uniref:Uncharacterized protein n=1 Tax=Caerostris darwini TaxID=1538125 RepID=A0AAV4VX25_9ARAC|nr:hypothetical protein CDAR_164901 [Caerostris darwini]
MGVGYTLPRIVCSFAAYHTTLIAPNRNSIQMICSTHFEKREEKRGEKKCRKVILQFLSQLVTIIIKNRQNRRQRYWGVLVNSTLQKRCEVFISRQIRSKSAG